MLEQSNHWAQLVIYVIGAGTTASLLWAFLGKVDQTVTAVGRLEPATGSIDVRSTTPGIVKHLWVKEGQEVRSGDRLAEIENLGLRARLESTNRQLQLLRYENQLLNLLIDRGGVLPPILPPPSASIANEERVRSIQLSVQENAAQLRQLKARLASQQETLRLKQELVQSLFAIYRAGGFARFDYLKAKDEVQQWRSQITQTREQFNQLVSEAGRQSTVNDRQLLNLEAERISLQEAARNLLLRANGPGRIFNLGFRPGSVINANTQLMRIIPEGSLRASLFLANTDLGFVRENQPAKLSISSFPSSEYGYLDGRVSRIGADALDPSSTPDQRRTDQFPLQVTLGPNLHKARLISRLKPGMQVSALIVVRQRPVITLLTDTFTKGRESLQNGR
jgi:HlyD family secretion protein